MFCSNQSLRCPHKDTLHPWLSKMRPVKIVIRLGECHEQEAQPFRGIEIKRRDTIIDMLQQLNINKKHCNRGTPIEWLAETTTARAGGELGLLDRLTTLYSDAAPNYNCVFSLHNVFYLTRK